MFTFSDRRDRLAEVRRRGMSMATTRYTVALLLILLSAAWRFQHCVKFKQAQSPKKIHMEEYPVYSYKLLVL